MALSLFYITDYSVHTIYMIYVEIVAVGGLLVSVLAIGPNVRGFKTGQGRCIFKGDKIRSTTSFGGEVKPSVTCREILRQVKDLYSMKRDKCQYQYQCEWSGVGAKGDPITATFF
jgi:hypothetical protein